MAYCLGPFQAFLRAVLVLASGAVLAGAALACPFCSATQQTLGEELASRDAAVLAELVKAPPPYDPNQDQGASYRGFDPEANNATFRIVDRLRGGEHLIGVETIQVPFFGPADKEKLYLITGIRTDRVDWSTPLPLSKAAQEYVRKLPELPEKGADRLEFFQEYLEHEDSMLAQDAYDEFARSPYDAVIALKDRMHHDRLVAWIHDVEVAPSRRRLYLTMLGVCGGERDLPLLEYYMSPTEAHYKAAVDAALAMGLSLPPHVARPALYEAAERYERLKKQGLDAMIACYLTLKGAEGLPLVEDLFLRDPHGDFKDIFSAIYALRFHGEETDVIDRQRLIESMRLVLDNPTFADQVIADLSRWEDWGVMDRLAEMFKEADENSYIRQPVASYMLIASEQEGEVGERAATLLEEIRQVDEKAVADAERNLSFGLFAGARPAQPGATDSADTAVSTEVAAEANASPAADFSTAATRIAPPNEAEPTVDDSAGAPDADNLAAAEALSDDTVPPTTAGGDDAPAADHDAAAAEAATEREPSADRVARAGSTAQVGGSAQRMVQQEESLPTPSRLAIIAGAVVAVAVLAGLFTLLLRGLGSRAA